MFDIIMLVISVLILVLGGGAYIAITYKKKSFERRYNVSLLVIVAFAMFPLYFSGNANAVGGFFDALVMSLLGVFRAVTGENSLSETREIINASSELQVVILNYTAILHLMSAVLLIGIVASFVKNFYSRITYNFFEKGVLCVFTDISERSILLAQNINEHNEKINTSDKTLNNKKYIMVFLGKLRASEEKTYYYDKIKEIGAHIFDLSMPELKLNKRFLQNTVHYFFLKENEEENIKDAMLLAQTYIESLGKDAVILPKDKEKKKDKDKPKPKIPAKVKIKNRIADYKKHKNNKINLKSFILTSSPNATAIIDAIKHSEYHTMRHIDETDMMINQMLDEKPLFLAQQDNKLKILVIGAGRTGTSFTKAASWMGQMLPTESMCPNRPEIIVVDSDETWIDRFEFTCPELLDKKGTLCSKNEFKLSFYAQDVFKDGLVDIIRSNSDINYVVCAIGDDDLNVNVALKVRAELELVRFEKYGAKSNETIIPVNVLVNNNLLFNITSKINYENKNSSDLSPFGNLKDLYTLDNIVDSYYDCLGLAVNRFYSNEYRDKSWRQLLEEENLTSKGEADENTIQKANAKLIEEGISKTDFDNTVIFEADRDYHSTDYLRSSSRASGMHMKTKVYSALRRVNKLGDFDWTKKLDVEIINKYKEAIKNPELAEEISILEHRRWNVYMRAHGWRYTDGESAKLWCNANENDHRNYTSKLHLCLVPWDELENVEKWRLENDKVKEDLKELDITIALKIPEIIKTANELEMIK